MLKENVVLVDNLGKMIQKVNIKMTVKEAKEILLRRKVNYVM